MLKPATTDIDALKTLDDRLRWLSAWTIHHANHVRTSDDGLKVGGHQASCASMTAIMAALYFHALGPNDRVAVKPHAGPVLHTIHYLVGSQSREALENFRGFGGAQSYPSRTKDRIPVDFSTGSVGLGVAITLFASLVQDYLTAHGWLDDKDRGRVAELRYGKRLQAALDSNAVLKKWFEGLSNAELSALHYQGGATWRKRIEADLGKKAVAFLKSRDDEALGALFADLGGHCMETL